MYGNDEIKALAEAAQRVFTPDYYGGMDEIPHAARPQTLKDMRHFLSNYRKEVAQQAVGVEKSLAGRYGGLTSHTAGRYQRYADREIRDLGPGYQDTVLRSALQSVSGRGQKMASTAQMTRQPIAQPARREPPPEAADQAEEGDALPLPSKRRRIEVRPGQAPKEVARVQRVVKPGPVRKPIKLEPDEDDRETLSLKGGGVHGHLRRLTRNKDAHEEYFVWRTGRGITEAYELTADERKARISKRIAALGVKADAERSDSPVFRRGRSVPPDEVKPPPAGNKVAVVRKSPPTIIAPVKPDPEDAFASLPKRPPLPDWMKKEAREALAEVLSRKVRR